MVKIKWNKDCFLGKKGNFDLIRFDVALALLEQDFYLLSFVGQQVVLTLSCPEEADKPYKYLVA